MTTMAIWKRREAKRAEAQAEREVSELLRRELFAKASQLDKFVASLRMQIDEPPERGE